MKIVTVDQMRRIEAASDAQGHSYAAMMERAGGAVARVIQTRLAVRGRQILVLVGPGNNGGDGLVAARHLHDAGAHVLVYLLKERDDEHLTALLQRNVSISTSLDLTWLRHCAIIVDALLGTGASRPITGELATILKLVSSEVTARRSAAPDLIDPARPTRHDCTPLIVAVDGPTGLNYDTGELDPLSIPADVSVTFAYPKIGHTRFPGTGACGDLIVADIGTDPKLADEVELELADPMLIRSLLPARPANAHKGTFGKTLIVSGSTLYTGAPVLAATAAYRAGAGLVTLATPRSIHASVAAKINEATFLPLSDSAGVLNKAAATELDEICSTYEAILIGPGLTIGAREFLVSLLARQTIHVPIVLDADALNSVAQIDQWWTQMPAPAILTPHPGEMSRLTKLSVKDIEADRLSVAIEFAKRWGHVVVLKGAFTVIAAPDGRSMIMPFANPALATAGSGDVLAGTIAAMVSQGLKPYEAAVCGAYLHGAAGELVRREIGSAGVLAGDLLERLPQVLQTLL